MFRVGELVRTSSRINDGKIGLVVATKEKNLNQFCKIIWADKTAPEWVMSNNLYEV